MRSPKSCGGSTKVGGLKNLLSERRGIVLGDGGKLCLVEGRFWFGMAIILDAYLLVRQTFLGAAALQ